MLRAWYFGYIMGIATITQEDYVTAITKNTMADANTDWDHIVIIFVLQAFWPVLGTYLMIYNIFLFNII